MLICQKSQYYFGLFLFDKCPVFMPIPGILYTKLPMEYLPSMLMQQDIPPLRSLSYVHKLIRMVVAIYPYTGIHKSFSIKNRPIVIYTFITENDPDNICLTTLR